MKAIIGKKIGMTQLFCEDGTVVPVTLIQATPNVVTQVKTKERDGYTAVQIGMGNRKRAAKAQSVAWKNLGTFEVVKEVRLDESNMEVGAKMDVSIFSVGDRVDVVGTSKGKGFQGVVRRHGFHGHNTTHGTKDAVRMPGSIGAGGPQRVFKGMRMAGHMGDKRITVKNLEVAQVRAQENILALKGAIPGSRNSVVLIQARA